MTDSDVRPTEVSKYNTNLIFYLSFGYIDLK